MRINGAGFKIDTTPPPDTTGQAVATDPAEQVGEELFNDFFTNMGTITPEDEPVQSENVVNRYIFESASAAATVGNADFLEFLDNTPPSVEKIIIDNPQAFEYMDILIKKYEKLAEDITKVFVNAGETLKDPTLTASQISYMNLVISKSETALIRTGQEISKTKEIGIRLGNNEILEKQTFKDINNDGVIGRKGSKDAVIVAKDVQGNTVYLDSNGKLLVNPIFAPDYEAQLFDDNGAVKVADDQADGYTLSLQLTERALASPPAGMLTSLTIFQPLAFWVKKDANGEPALNTDVSSDVSLKIYDQWDDANGGIKQKIPPDRQNFTQQKVGKIAVVPVDSGLRDAAGNVINHHVVKYYTADGTLIATVKIEGFRPERNYPAATTLRGSTGNKYVPATAVGLGAFGMYGPIEWDFSKTESTGRHVVQDFAGRIGINDIPSEGKAREAFDATTKPFTKGMGEAGFGDFNDKYIAPSEANGEATGVFVYGFAHGIVKGSRFDDAIKTVGANDPSPEAQALMPDGESSAATQMKKTNGQYPNFIYGDAGTNFVFNTGSAHIFDMTGGWITGTDEDEVFIATSKIDRLHEGGALDAPSNNPATFIHVENVRADIEYEDESDIGAENRALDQAANRVENAEQAALDRGEEQDDADRTEDEILAIQQEELGGVEEIYKNDFLEAEGGASVAISGVLYPEEILGGLGRLSTRDALNRTRMEAAAQEKTSKWHDEMLKLPEVDEAEIQEFIQKAGAAETELANEMDGFFSSWFGDISSYFTEQEVQPVAGAAIANTMGEGGSEGSEGAA